MLVNILYHRNCFDGLVSASLFTSFYKQCISEQASFSYIRKQHGNSPVFENDDFSGEVNACLDFRYSTNPKLHWWFDHHVSAFDKPTDKDYFMQHPSSQHFYDPTRGSNGKFMADTLQKKFGFKTEPYAELIKWVEIIDSAKFPNPHMPVELKEPAIQLMTWVEHTNNRRAVLRLIRDLQKEPITDIITKNYIRKPFEKFLKRHQEHLGIFQKRIQIQGDVAYFDLTEENIHAYNKFIVYHYYENILYTVGLTCFPKRCKISVGSNPWDRGRRQHNIAQICEKYGGGGHAVVGAITMPSNEISRAKEIAQEIVAILNNQKTL